MLYREFKSGRRFIGRLEHGQDLITCIETVCIEKGIQMGVFSIIGAVSSATLGFYDQKKQVYGSFKENAHLEIVSCTGNISIKDEKPFVHAHAVLSDESGKTIAGHLFSETPVFAGEFDIREVTGSVFSRAHDNTTGLMLWHDDE